MASAGDISQHCRDVAYLTSDQEPTVNPDSGRWRLKKEEAARFFSLCLTRAGASSEQAKAQAAMMVVADQRGFYSYGSGLLDACVCGLISGAVKGRAEPKILKQSGGSALVEGDGGLGAYVGTFCMNLAVEKAKKTGIGCVVCRNSNHFGIAGYYSLLAAEQGLIGISTSNALPSVCPTRSSAPPSLGSNPLSCAAFGAKDRFVLDMGTAAAVRGKVQERARNNSGMPLGWGVDEEGLETSSPFEALEKGGLEPLGGDAKHSGHKGYCMGMTVEVLCSCLSGGTRSPDMAVWRDHSPKEPADISHCFIVIDPAAFNPQFAGSLQGLLDKMHDLPKIGKLPVLVAGDREDEEAKNQERTILYETRIVEIFRKLASRLGLPLPNLAK